MLPHIIEQEIASVGHTSYFFGFLLTNQCILASLKKIFLCRGHYVCSFFFFSVKKKSCTVNSTKSAGVEKIKNNVMVRGIPTAKKKKQMNEK